MAKKVQVQEMEAPINVAPKTNDPINIEIRLTNPKGYGSVMCGPYYNSRGKLVQIIDPNDDVKYFTFRRPVTTWDISHPDVAVEYEWLKDHPYCNGHDAKLKMINTEEEARVEVEHKDSSFEALIIVKELRGEKMADFARLMGIATSNINESVVKSKLYQEAEKSPKSVLDAWHDNDRTLKSILHKGKDKGIFRTNRGGWKYGEYAMGATFGHALQWLKDNEDILPSVRKEVNSL